MKNKRIIGLFVLLCGVLAGLSAGRLAGDDKAVRAVAEPILDNILAAYAGGDYAAYTRDFDATAKEALTKEVFAAANAQIQGLFGDYQGRGYLGFMHKGDMTVVMWKGTFNKAADDVLIKVVLSQRDGKVVVTGLWFQ